MSHRSTAHSSPTTGVRSAALGAGHGPVVPRSLCGLPGAERFHERAGVALAPECPDWVLHVITRVKARFAELDAAPREGVGW
jgi:hypothetical protein